MPPRSNLFQDVVAVVHRLIGEGAEIEESAMLVHAQTGDTREVDVVIRSMVAGQEILVSVEASATRRRADVKWVEQLICKHRELPTNKLVLVSESGYSRQARRLAEANSVALVELGDLDGADLESVVVGKLSSLWPKAVRLEPDRVVLHLRRPDAAELTVISAPFDMEVVGESGDHLTDLRAYVHAQLGRRDWLFSQIGLADITENMERWFTAGAELPTWDVVGSHVGMYGRFIHDDGTAELHRIEKIEIIGRASIEVQEMTLQHGRLGDVAVSYGEATIFGTPTAMVATVSGGREVVTTRVRNKGQVTESADEIEQGTR